MTGQIPPDKSFLKRMRIGELDKETQDSILALANEFNYERSIKATSNLGFLWELYNAEKTKEKRSRTRLKKAEAMMMKLASLRHGALQKEIGGPRQAEAEKRPFHAAAYAGRDITIAAVSINERLRKIFESIGIKDEKIMVRAVESLGEKEVEERAEIALASNIGTETVKAVFGIAPQLILEQDFDFEIETIEQKKEVLDFRKEQSPLPAELDYSNKPEVLLKGYPELAGLLKLKPPQIEKAEPEEKMPKIKYKGKPMHPRNFVKVIRELGFALVREAKHGQLYENIVTKASMCVQRAHIAQFMINGSTIKKKLMEADVEPDEFEAMRVRLKL